MSELESWWDRFTVASQVLVSGWTDLCVRGYDKEPNLTAAALEDVEAPTRELRNAGFGAEGDVAQGRVELIEEATEYGSHTCTCRYCVHAEPRGPVDDLPTLTVETIPHE
ncbi:hypothetical protein [Streptomyces sp. NPDC050416]|uniref:hypothetical protein n=1 Tax=Streptomyces sp. NPDC050416 TaxID=3365611 RepID=UPI00378A3A7E